MKTAVVTGGNKGIGREIVRQLKQEGFHVVLAARDEKRGSTAAAEEGAEFIRMDVADEKSILEFAKQFGKKFNHLDVLVNNAGILKKEDRSVLASSQELMNETFAVNAYGPVRVTKALLPFLGNGSRVIMVSSGGGSMSDDIAGWAPVYCVSKTLLNAFTRHLAHELAPKGIFVNAICPGWVRTDMGGKGAPRTVQQGADTVTWLATTDKVHSGGIFRDRKKIDW
ncbi:MAG TPA: SDR family oxidoreductase [Bacteroidia bacterium]|nr:SDR family oxidoreductase [Bacteroidia bacterium]